MGNKKNKYRVNGEVRPGPQKRAKLALLAAARPTEDARKQTHADQKRMYRERLQAQKEAEINAATTTSGQGSVEDARVGFGERDKRRIALKMADFCYKQLRECPTLHSQTEVMELFLGHHLIKLSLPAYYLPPKEAKAHADLLKNQQSSMQLVKGVQSLDKLASKRSFLTASVSGTQTTAVRATARILNIHHSNISRAIVRRRVIDSEGEGLWALGGRKKRSDHVPDATRAIVLAWWVNETRVSPNKKDVVRQRVSRKVYDTQPAHYLLETQTAFFLRFKSAHPNVKVGQRLFELLRPFFVKRLKDRNVCCCKYHVEMAELKDGFNNMRTAERGVHSPSSCTCDCNICRRGPVLDGEAGCQANKHPYKGVTWLWQEIVCPKGELDEWHRRDCLMGECLRCGSSKLSICPVEANGCDLTVQWRCYAKENVGEKDGAPRMRLKLQYQTTSSVEFLSYFKPKLQAFVRHNFVARWQDAQFKASLKSLPENTILSVVDFAENYTFTVQNEVQEMHWHSFQITILVHITYRWNPHPDVNDPDSKVLKEMHFYISDDNKHDTLFVQHCFRFHWNYLAEAGFRPESHWVWSDGCAAQFKGARPWYFVSRYPHITGGCTMWWNFFGSGHGKGEHDGAGAVIKRALRAEQLNSNGVKLQNAAEAVAFLRKNLSTRPPSSYSKIRTAVKRHFWLVGTEDVDRTQEWDCKTVPGTRSLHSILGRNKSDPTKLMVRDLACFCPHCLDLDWDNCISIAHAQKWKLQTLQPTNTTAVRRQIEEEGDEEQEFGGDGEDLASCLDAGDNFACNAEAGNSEGVDFYLLCCERPVHVVMETFTDGWGSTFDPGEHVVAGRYYQLCGRRDKAYKFLSDQPLAFLYSHLVRAIKFAMPPATYRVKGKDAVFTLSADALEGINEALAAMEDR